ncbi:MAG: PQQ-binding-like beta-propeller repeat protein, partial [Polyangiaceae bacterium]
MSERCANCGSLLEPPPLGQSFVQCQYCGHRSQLAPPPVQLQQQHIIIVQPPPTTYPTYTPPGWMRIFWVLPFLLVVPGILAAVFAGRVSSRTGSRTGSGVGSGGETSGEHLQWSQETPFPAKLNADATEDFVGHYRVLDLGGGKTKEFVGGYDGATLKRVWAAGPYGDQDDTRGLHMAVVAGSVLVTDQKLTGHILDAATGKETATITLSDRADSICVEPTGKPEAWIKVSDNQDLDVDFTTKRTKKMPRPSWCKTPELSSGCARDRSSASLSTCADVDSTFSAPSFRGKETLTEGTTTVVVGEKSPGTRMPTAIGYDPKAKKILWQRPIPQSDSTSVSDGLGLTELGAGRLVSQVQLSTGISKLVAIDAKTGGPLWTTEIPRSKDGSAASEMLVTATRVYLPHWTWLDVFDAKTGAVVGT